MPERWPRGGGPMSLRPGAAPPTTERVLGLTPAGHPAPRLVVALGRARALGLLDPGLDRARALEAIAAITRRYAGSWGVRIVDGGPLRPDDLPPAVDTVLLERPADASPWAGRRVLRCCRCRCCGRSAPAWPSSNERRPHGGSRAPRSPATNSRRASRRRVRRTLVVSPPGPCPRRPRRVGPCGSEAASSAWATLRHRCRRVGRAPAPPARRPTIRSSPSSMPSCRRPTPPATRSSRPGTASTFVRGARTPHRTPRSYRPHHRHRIPPR
jgi:hypothetical protein